MAAVVRSKQTLQSSSGVEATACEGNIYVQEALRALETQYE